MGKKTTTNTCLCGCGTKTANARRQFLQGHDAKLAGRGRRGEGPFTEAQRSWLRGHGIRLRRSRSA